MIIQSLYPILFSASINHNEFKGFGTITGAGFIDDNGRIYGESISLKMGPGEDDQEIIDVFLRRHTDGDKA